MKGNVIQMNTLHLNSVRLNGIGKVQSVSLKGGSTEDPVFPPVEPPIEPEPTPTYTLSASVANGVVSATLNGVVVSLPYTANEGDVIVLSVTPNDGYEFNGWADGNTDNPRTITMASDVVLSAECSEVVQPPVGNYIQFEDKAVEAICVENWSSDGIGLTEEDAAAVTTIGTIFKGNTEITSFNEFRYFTKVTSLSSNAFNGCSALEYIKIPTGIATIPYGAFQGAGIRTIESNCTLVKDSAFKNCKNLESVSLPSVVTIEQYAFNSCNLLNVAATPNVESIGTSAFYGCSALSAIDTLKVKVLGGFSLYQCASLSVLEFGGDVTSIGNSAMEKCTSLQKVIVRASTPPSLGNTNALANTNSCPIYVPDASLEAYKTATNWNTYADRIHPLSEIEGVVIEDGYELNSNGTLKESANYFVVGFIGINGGESITWGASSGFIGNIVEYDESGNYKDYWGGYNTKKRTITTNSASKQIKACFLLSQKDSAYILDNTNGKYLWKGANVE